MRVQRGLDRVLLPGEVRTGAGSDGLRCGCQRSRRRAPQAARRRRAAARVPEGRPRWHDVTSRDINDFVKEIVGGDVSAKDFRTWHGTVIAAVSLASSAPSAGSRAERRRALRRAAEEVADQLGNTPTVARTSYMDPRVVEQVRGGGNDRRHVRQQSVASEAPTGRVGSRATPRPVTPGSRRRRSLSIRLRPRPTPVGARRSPLVDRAVRYSDTVTHRRTCRRRAAERPSAS